MATVSVAFAWVGGGSALGEPLEAAYAINVTEEYHLDPTGQSDNYAKLRAWADDVNQRGGGTYFFPRGIYLIDRHKTIDPSTEQPLTVTRKYDRKTNSCLDETILIENITFRDCDGLVLIGDGATLSVSGKFHRKADHEMGGMQYSTTWQLTPLRFMNCRNIVVEGFSLDGNNQEATKDPGVMEWQGHGLMFVACEHFKIKNVTVQRFTVDGIFVGGDLDLESGKERISRFMEFDNVRCLRNGRQGFSMCGGAYGVFNNCEFAYTGKTGGYGYHGPAAGLDIEPHHSPLGDNTGDRRYTSDEFNGFMSFNNCKFHDNVGGALFVTSTMLTKSVSFNNCVIEVDPDAGPDSILMGASCESTVFHQCDIRARTPKGVDASIYVYMDGLAQEKTGVLAGKVTKVSTVFRSCSFEGGRMWTNDNNDADPGQLGLHNFKFVDCSFNDTHFLWRTRRRMVFENVLLYYPAGTKIENNVIHNAIMRDSLFRADSRVTVDLGSGGNQSAFTNLGVQLNVSLGGSERFLEHFNVEEGMEFYSWSRALKNVMGVLEESSRSVSLDGNLLRRTTVILPNSEGPFGHRVLIEHLENGATYTLTGTADVMGKEEKRYCFGYGLAGERELVVLREQFTSESFTYTFTVPEKQVDLVLKAYLISPDSASISPNTITLSDLRLVRE